MDVREIIEACNNFLIKSDNRFANTISRAVDDMRRYSGDFWTKEYRKKYKRKNRVNLSLNNWNPMANAISSPMSNSPWHIELVNKEKEFEEIQKAIDTVEADTDTKSALVDAFRKAVLTGYGYLVVSTDTDEYTGLPKVIVETASHIDAIAFDPSCNTVEGADAEEGAVINYMPVKKAKRLFGADVVPMAYPDVSTYINFASFKQWEVPEDSVAVISYYVKENDGVMFYKIVGDKVVQNVKLPIKFIPIIRLAGNEIYESDQINYNGIIQQTLTLELGANIAYSSLIERVGRSAKANIMANVDAIDGLEKNLAAMNQDDTVAVLWKGEHQPVLLTEGFETGDLQNTISTCRTLMEDTLGIPLTGIIDQRERTATEILRQETSKESNTASYYNNAYKAVRTLGKIVIELLNEGNDLQFTLENGPSVITREMKARQELSAMGTIMPDEMKPILAKYFADTLKNDLGEELSRNIVANLPPNLKFIADNQDPAAVHTMNMMQAQMEQTMAALEASQQQVYELQKQLDAAQLSMMNQREQRILDFNKFSVAEQDKMMIETAKLQQQGVKIDNDAMLKQQEINIKAAESAVADAQKETDAEIREQQAYIQGVSDTVEEVVG
jgi:hypothetical protein